MKEVSKADFYFFIGPKDVVTSRDEGDTTFYRLRYGTTDIAKVVRMVPRYPVKEKFYINE